MKHLRALNKYFWKYRVRLAIGILFIVVSNYFGVLSPQVTGFIIDHVERKITTNEQAPLREANYDVLVNIFINYVRAADFSVAYVIIISGITILVLALLRGFFMFLMRQTIIVMSRHIEFDQKNEVFNHYQELDAAFYKIHSTGDLMSRVAEDVSRVRMFTGPAIMYLINLTALISFSLFFMFKRDAELTLYVLAPLPLLAVTIYYVNNIIHRKSEHIQSLLSDLTTNAQESYSGIRVIKSFVQERAMLGFFETSSEKYKNNAISLAKVEAIYFPSMTLLIGLSTLLTIMIGGLYYINNPAQTGIDVIVEFVIYINMLTFPVSAIGWTASMIQRAAASQKRLNEFLHIEPEISSPPGAKRVAVQGNIIFENVGFVYRHTGIQALQNFNLNIRKGEKIAVIGRTGSGKSTIAQLLLRMYDVSQGRILCEGVDIREIDLQALRELISYVPQDVFLFSDSVKNNISFGSSHVDFQQVVLAATRASIHNDIASFPEQYETMIGERGVTLSGGQKQRISIARALVKEPQLVIFDDCLSAVDAKTEKDIISNLYDYLKDKTAIVITHRIFSLFHFDQVIVLDEGMIVEKGTHEELLGKQGYYYEIYLRQQQMESEPRA